MKGDPAVWYREPTAADVSARIETHEQVCAERWKQILERMSRMERIIYSAVATLLSGMGVMIWQLLSKSLH